MSEYDTEVWRRRSDEHRLRPPLHRGSAPPHTRTFPAAIVKAAPCPMPATAQRSTDLFELGVMEARSTTALARLQVVDRDSVDSAVIARWSYCQRRTP